MAHPLLLENSLYPAWTREKTASSFPRLSLKVGGSSLLSTSSGEVGDGTHAKDKSADPDKSQRVTSVIEGGSARLGETKEEVEEEDDGAKSEVDLDVAEH